MTVLLRPCNLSWLSKACARLDHMKRLRARMDLIVYSMQVGVNYDPMIAKVIVRGPDRQTALQRMHSALSQLQA